jgi:hypothetical protein
MKAIYTLVICAGFLSGTVLAQTINFDDAKTGAPPPGWKSAVTSRRGPFPAASSRCSRWAAQ